MAGLAIPFAGGAAMANDAGSVARGVGAALTSAPAKQLVSSAAAGGAGQYVRETGGTPGAQVLASLAAGVAAPSVLGGAQGVAGAVRSATQNLVNPAMAPLQVDIQINNALKDSGMTMADLPQNIQSGLRSDVQSAMSTSGAIAPDAVRRLADYRLTGTTPTAATLTLDPAMVSQQKNLAKLGINSKDVAAQQLGRVENANNQQLINNLNDLGASTVDDSVAGGQKVASALLNKDAAARKQIGDAYAAARETDGRSMELDPQIFTEGADKLLGYNLLRMKVPGDVKSLLNSVATGDTPLTVDTAEEIKTRLGDLQRTSTNGGEIKALGLIRQSLDRTPLINNGAGYGQESIDAFNKARGMNATWMDTVENTPALAAVREGVAPDQFVQKFVIGTNRNANIMDVASLKHQIADNPDAMNAVRGQITSYLKQTALNGANDEVGKFSQSAYNKALNAIGDRKLQLFFPDADMQQLKAIGRVASYEQFQPAGAAVNNSNTASTALGALLDRVGNSPLLSKVPFGKSLAEPLQNISVGIKSKKAMDVTQSLNRVPDLPARPPSMLIPAGVLMQMQGNGDASTGLLSP